MEIRKLIKELNDHYPEFENFRDFSAIPNKLSNRILLKEDLLFRSSSLAKYNTSILKSFIKRKNIKYIIDLRHKEEFSTYNFDERLEYPTEFASKYVKNIPLNPLIDKHLKNGRFKHLYLAILQNYTSQIRDVFEHIAKTEREKLIIHCQAGVDRTGIIVALLLDLLGVERNIILMDYLLSERYLMKSENLSFLFSNIDENYGNTFNYLQNRCEIDLNVLKSVKKQLIKRKKV